MESTRRQFIAFGASLPLMDLSVLELLAQDNKLEIETVLKNGPKKKRYDLLLLPEGYTKDHRKEFDEDVGALLKAFDDYHAFKEYKPLINVHKIWIASEKEWHKDVEAKDTLFGVTYNPAGKIPTFAMSKDGLREFKLRDDAEADHPCIIVRDSGKVSAGIGYRNRMAAPPDPQCVFFHELGHGLGLADEYAQTLGLGPNVSIDEKNVPWKALLDQKIEGVGIYKVEGEKPYFRGEEGPCLMRNDRRDFGVICTSSIASALRKFARPIENAPEEKPMTVGWKKPLNIEIITCPSRAYTPSVQAWYCSGKKQELDKQAEDLRKACSEKDFADKKWKKAALKTEEKNTAKHLLTDSFTSGSYLFVVLANDPNPALILDPGAYGKDKRIYRIDVK